MLVLVFPKRRESTPTEKNEWDKMSLMTSLRTLSTLVKESESVTVRKVMLMVHKMV